MNFHVKECLGVEFTAKANDASGRLAFFYLTQLEPRSGDAVALAPWAGV